MKQTVTAKSLDTFKRSFLGAIPKIWNKLPKVLVDEGEKSSWSKIKQNTNFVVVALELRQRPVRIMC